MRSTLAERTRELLKTRPRTVTYEKIAADTGLKRRWLNDFAGDTHGTWCVGRVETLYNYLSGKPLFE